MSTALAARERDKLLRLVEMLTRLARMRQRPVYDYDAHEQVVWFHSIPEEQRARSLLSAAPDARDREVWLHVQAYSEPAIPRVPREFAAEADQVQLRDSSTEPAFPERERAQESPGARARWEAYVTTYWLPWAEKHRAWRQVQELYDNLFRAHLALKANSESLELVLALGLLRCSNPRPIRRHIVVADAEIEHDAERALFTVRAGEHGAQFRQELDLLEAAMPPAIETRLAACLQQLGDDEWTTPQIHAALREFVHGLAPTGRFDEAVCPRDHVDGAGPLLDFAPALVLRKRVERGLTEALRKLKEGVSAGATVTPEFARLAELDAWVGEHATPQMDAEPLDPLFPRPANEEQKRIAARLASSTGLLVQGPPGTGKTHTIANLICHLLAQGERVLVTAKTQRALQSLHEKLPEEVKPLCVSLIGEGKAQRDAIEKSVRAILTEHDTGADHHGRRATRLKGDRDRLLVERAKVLSRLRARRAAEHDEVDIVDGSYRGTVARVAEVLDGQRDEYGWLEDAVGEATPYPFHEIDWQALLADLRWLDETKYAELGLHIPDVLPDPSEVSACLDNLSACEEAMARCAPHMDAGVAERLAPMTDGDFAALVSAVEELLRTIEPLRSSVAWERQALGEVLSGRHDRWQTIFDESETALSEARSAIEHSGQTYEGTGDRDLRVVRADADALRDHMSKGGRVGWGPFRPGLVRDRLYLVRLVRVDGELCRDVARLTRLINTIAVDLLLGLVWQVWSGLLDRTAEPRRIQLARLDAAKTALLAILGTAPLRSRVAHLWTGGSLGTQPEWASAAACERVDYTLQYECARRGRARCLSQLGAWEEGARRHAAQVNAHPICARAAGSIAAGQRDVYARVHAEWTDLMAQHVRRKTIKDRMRVVSEYAPKLERSLWKTAADLVWDNRVAAMMDAWQWARGVGWLREFTLGDGATTDETGLRDIEQRLVKATAELAASHAWSHCLGRLLDVHRQHMVGWQQSMGRLGAGTGRHAPRHRRDARDHLEKCRAAVPAWIMPLHRVWDTVSVTCQAFDTIIVDEASQCDFEGLVLMYLARKVVVVGDSKQVSPEAVGVDQQTVVRIANELLPEFEHRDSFDPQVSLYDHAERRFAGNIALREHFRCMPEIIAFSNELSYPNSPLIPLRQYGPDRLCPLKAVHVADGLVQGQGERVANESEARALVAKLLECDRDPTYRGLTFGVVTLQGHLQAKIIANMLLHEDPRVFDRRKLVCGDPSAFQGDERDIMFASMVAAPNVHFVSLGTESARRRFNVAASRARDQMWLFHSVALRDLNANCVRHHLLSHFLRSHTVTISGVDAAQLQVAAAQRGRARTRPPDPFDSWFEVDVALAIAGRGFLVTPQFTVGSKRIDLVVFGSGGQRLAVECDGDAFHGPDELDADIARQRQLERVGWEFVRLRQSAFYHDRGLALDALWSRLEERGIHPSAATTEEEAHPTPLSDRPDDTGSGERPDAPERLAPETTPVVNLVGTTAPAAPRLPRNEAEQIGWRYVYKEVGADLSEPVEVVVVAGTSEPRVGTVNCGTALAHALGRCSVGGTESVRSPDPYTIMVLEAHPPGRAGGEATISRRCTQ